MFNANRLLLFSFTRGYRKGSSAETHESERSLEAIVELVYGGRSSVSHSTSSSSQARPFMSAILTSTNIHTNLATEDELHRRLAFASVTDLGNVLAKLPTKESEKGSTKPLTPPSSEPFSISSSHSDPLSLRCLSLLLSYINEPCVVIGRNQNPWQETNFRGIGNTHSDSSQCLNDGLGDSGSVPVVELARRSSGGGAVYHDLGNVCFSFMTHRTLYDPARSVEILRRYLLCRLAPFVRSEDITTTKRNDLFLFGHKITGSAMKVTSRGCYHHLTLLVASNRPSLGKYLTKHHRWEWVVSSAVDSVRSPVTTLAIALRGVPPEGKASENFAIRSPELAKYPPLIPTDRFVGEDIAALLFTAEGKGSFMSPYERLLWLASIDAAFGTPLATSKPPTHEELERIRSLTPKQQARLLQRDFCRFYEDCGGFFTPDALARMGSDLSVEGIVPYLYLSPKVVEPKQSTSKTAASGSVGTVRPASEAKAKELLDRSRGLVPFASLEYSINKTMLLEGFNGLYKTDKTCTDDKVVCRYSCITQRDIPLVVVNAESHFAHVKRVVHQDKAEEKSTAPQRSASQKLSDPRSLTEALEQQRSRVWLLKNTPKFTTLVRVPPFGRGNSAGSTPVKSPRGWAEFLSSSEEASSSSGTNVVGDRLNLPDIIIRTQVNGGGEIESVRCRFDHKAESMRAGSDSIASDRADVTEEEGAANWFSEVMGAMLRGKFLRAADCAVGETMAPFPPRPAFARGLRAAENSDERQLFAIATERSLNINLLSTVDNSAFVALARGFEAPLLSSAGGPSPSVLRALATSAVSPQLHQSIAVGDIDEVVNLLLLSASSALANSEVSTLLNDTVVDHLVAGLVGCWISVLIDAWEDANAW